MHVFSGNGSQQCHNMALLAVSAESFVLTRMSRLLWRICSSFKTKFQFARSMYVVQSVEAAVARSCVEVVVSESLETHLVVLLFTMSCGLTSTTFQGRRS